MNRKAIGVAIGGGVLVVLAVLVLYDVAQKPTEGELARYRTETTFTIADGDRTASGKAYTDCLVSYRHGWNTGRSIGIHPTGQSPFVVLGDRSILVLTGLESCPESTPIVGNTYRFDPDAPSSKNADRRIQAPYAHATRYDNIDDAKTKTLYHQQVLFRGGIDGLRVTEAKLAITELNPTTPRPDLVAAAFPWHKNTPSVPVGSQDYELYDHKRRFSGFIVGLDQLPEHLRCNKFDREAEGPLLVEGDRWDSCPPWGGRDLGWLVARPSADLSRIDYSYNERSPDKIATHYRATWLEARGAPGAKKVDSYFFWQPKLCFDGQCFSTHAARHSIWAGFRLYYPKKNQVISVEWVH
jgi:hypothetical protein